MENKKDEAFEAYYVKYYPQVYGYITKKISNEHTAEDLTMEVFYSCWNKFDSFDESKASFQTWLFVIVNNKLKNYYRDRKEMTELDDAILYDLTQEDDVLESIHLQHLRNCLYMAIKELNETQRTIVIYKYFKNMNALEIAQSMGLAHGNVRVQLKRAIDKIREYFNKNDVRWE